MRRIPSNRMPKHEPLPCTFRSIVAIAACFAVMGYLTWSSPLFFYGMPIFALLCVIDWHIQCRRQRRIAAERAGESICSFVRSFDCRATHTWILRAVYEQLVVCAGFPIRKSDHLFRDLRLDEMLDEVAFEIASRTGRSLEGASVNPYYGRVHTVADLVLFFGAQRTNDSG